MNNMWEKYLPPKKEIMSEEKYINGLKDLSIGTRNECIKQNLGKIRLANNNNRIYNQARSDCLASLPKGLDEEKILKVIRKTSMWHNTNFDGFQPNWDSLITALCEAYNKGELFSKKEKSKCYPKKNKNY